MVNIALWKLLNFQQRLKFENNMELKDTLINRPEVSNISSFHHNAEKELEIGFSFRNTLSTSSFFEIFRSWNKKST